MKKNDNTHTYQCVSVCLSISCLSSLRTHLKQHQIKNRTDRQEQRKKIVCYSKANKRRTQTKSIYEMKRNDTVYGDVSWKERNTTERFERTVSTEYIDSAQRTTVLFVFELALAVMDAMQ